MSSDPEAVAAAIAKNPDTAMARHLLYGNFEPSDLTYEDWIYGLYYGDGNVCIAIEAWWTDHFDHVDPEDTRLYFRLTEDDKIERAPPDEYGRSVMSHMHFAPTLQHHQDRATFILIEDSDFATERDTTRGGESE